MISINGTENRSRGPPFWKHNSNLLENKEYVSLKNVKYLL